MLKQTNSEGVIRVIKANRAVDVDDGPISVVVDRFRSFRFHAVFLPTLLQEKLCALMKNHHEPKLNY